MTSVLRIALLVFASWSLGGLVFAQGVQIGPPMPPVQTASTNRRPSITQYNAVGPAYVQPQRGMSGEVFRFAFDYNDPDEDPCVPCELWIDLDQNGEFEDSEKFAMTDLNPQDKFSTYHHMVYDLTIKNLTVNSTYSFRFNVSDGKEEAGYNSGPHTLDVVVPVGMPPKPLQEARAQQTVVGGRFSVEAKVLVYYQLTPTMWFDWDSVRLSINGGEQLVPVARKVEKGRFDLLYDYVTARLEFDLPVTMSEGYKTAVFTPLPYSNASLKGSKPIIGTIGFEPAGLLVEPYVFYQPKASLYGIRIGDPIVYTFGVLVGAPHVHNSDLDLDYAKMSFMPFEVRTRSKRVTQQPGGAQARHYTFELQYFGVPGTVEIPQLSIGAFTFKNKAVSVFSVDPPPKVPDTAFAYFQQIETLKYSAKLVPSPAPLLFERMLAWHYFVGLGATGLITVVFIYGWVLVRGFTRSRHARDYRTEVREAHSVYLREKSAYEHEKTTERLRTYAHALRRYVLALANTVDIPGFSVSRLVNEGGITSDTYRQWVSEKADLVDEERLQQLQRISVHPDLTTRVPRELLEELEALERAYFEGANA